MTTHADADLHPPTGDATVPPVVDVTEVTASRSAEIGAAVTATIGTPVIQGNRIELLRNGDEIFPAMMAAIEAATTSIDFMTFVYWTGDIAEKLAHALAERARHGVRVRVVIDAFGGRTMDAELIEAMRDAGCDVRWFRPWNKLHSWRHALHRTHRKILVCDNRVGFTGGVGIAAEWEGDARNPDEWRETHMRIEGPGAVALRSGFLTNWLEATNDVGGVVCDPLPQPDGPSGVQVVRGQPGRHTSDVTLAMHAVMGQVQERLWITTAYFAPDPDLRQVLRDAVARGVDVRLLVPGPHVDKRVCRVIARAFMESLLDAGVEIHEFMPTMLHAKTMVADDVAVVGSANFNGRSTDQDDESIVVVHDANVVAELSNHFVEDLARSQRMEPGRFRKRPLHHRMQEQVVRVLRQHA